MAAGLKCMGLSCRIIPYDTMVSSTCSHITRPMFVFVITKHGKTIEEGKVGVYSLSTATGSASWQRPIYRRFRSSCSFDASAKDLDPRVPRKGLAVRRARARDVQLLQRHVLCQERDVAHGRRAAKVQLLEGRHAGQWREVDVCARRLRGKGSSRPSRPSGSL